MIPRLRIIAGPNGSGKSTLVKSLSANYAVNFYQFINADVLNEEISSSLKTPCPFSIGNDALIGFVENSTYPTDVKQPFLSGKISITEDDYFVFSGDSVNSYTAAVVADFLKCQYLERKLSFSFETVFSHPSKVGFIKQAFENGYRTYMYFIATEDPAINLARISNRVLLGGHNVPQDKTIRRYQRSLEQIMNVLPFLTRAYFFDNTDKPVFLAEYSSDTGITLHSTALPYWFKHFVLAE